MHFINHFHNRNHYIKDNTQKGFLKILLLLQKAILRLSDGAVYKENRKSPFAHKYEALPENDLHCCQWAFRFKFYSEEFHPLLLMWSNVLADEADLGTPVRGTPSANVHPLNQCAEWVHLSQLLQGAFDPHSDEEGSCVISLIWHTDDLVVLSLTDFLWLSPQQLLTSEGCYDTAIIFLSMISILI